MKQLVGCFVGYAMDLLHPFAIATNHSEALHIVGDLRYEYGFRHNDIPGQYGYIVDDDGEFSVVSREQAVEIAKEDHVLRPGYENESRLQSYMVLCWRNRDLFLSLMKTAEYVAKQFAGRDAQEDILEMVPV